MTQVKEWTNPELNMELALLMGYTKDKHYPGRVTREGTVTMPKDYCTDPAASLEVQAVAIKANAKKYFNQLERRMHPGLEELPESENWSAFGVAELFNAKPRERAEAAYITLQGEK